MIDTIGPGSQVQVVKAWQPIYADPLILRGGDKVKTGRRDTEWPGWIWCINAEGKGGWVPEVYLLLPELEGALAEVKQDYSALELPVSPGDRLVIGLVESGWCWATAESGQSGWTPLMHVKLIEG